jgi:hypothetical protein
MTFSPKSVTLYHGSYEIKKIIRTRRITMKKMFTFGLILLLWPTISLADRQGYPPHYGNGPYGQYRQTPSYPYHRGGGQRYYPYQSYRHNDDWIIPLAIFGTALGIMALSQPYNPPPPPPRLCRDTYNYVDQYGRYLYSEYVDRPCNY